MSYVHGTDYCRIVEVLYGTFAADAFIEEVKAMEAGEENPFVEFEVSPDGNHSLVLYFESMFLPLDALKALKTAIGGDSGQVTWYIDPDDYEGLEDEDDVDEDEYDYELEDEEY